MAGVRVSLVHAEATQHAQTGLLASRQPAEQGRLHSDRKLGSFASPTSEAARGHGGANAAQELAVRVLGSAASAPFRFHALAQAACDPSASGGCATVSTADAGYVDISATSPVEAAVALAHYCRRFLHMQFAWSNSGSNQIRTPATWPTVVPAVGATGIMLQRRCARGQPRCYSYFMNVCTLSCK